MNKIPYNLLNEISEGLIVLNEKLEICFWNYYMGILTGILEEEVVGQEIFQVLPSLNIPYFHRTIQDVIEKGHKMFFSAAMHKELVHINKNYNLNLKASGFMNDDSHYLLLEFIDVTNQFIQINRLKEYVSELRQVNKELIEKEKTIRDLAYYDQLTGLANRTLFYDLADKCLDIAQRNDIVLCLMFLDIDKFKNINDNFGHKVGDKVIQKVAELLSEVTGEDEIVARYGGDEFLILMPNLMNHGHEELIARIFNSKNKSIIHDGQKINISFSIGVSFYPHDGTAIDKLITVADHAMYVAKAKEGADNCYCNSCGLCSICQ